MNQWFSGQVVIQARRFLVPTCRKSDAAAWRCSSVGGASSDPDVRRARLLDGFRKARLPAMRMTTPVTLNTVE